MRATGLASTAMPTVKCKDVHRELGSKEKLEHDPSTGKFRCVDDWVKGIQDPSKILRKREWTKNQAKDAAKKDKEGKPVYQSPHGYQLFRAVRQVKKYKGNMGEPDSLGKEGDEFTEWFKRWRLDQRYNIAIDDHLFLLMQGKSTKCEASEYCRVPKKLASRSRLASTEDAPPSDKGLLELDGAVDLSNSDGAVDLPAWTPRLASTEDAPKSDLESEAHAGSGSDQETALAGESDEAMPPSDSGDADAPTPVQAAEQELETMEEELEELEQKQTKSKRKCDEQRKVVKRLKAAAALEAQQAASKAALLKLRETITPRAWVVTAHSGTNQEQQTCTKPLLDRLIEMGVWKTHDVKKEFELHDGGKLALKVDIALIAYNPSTHCDIRIECKAKNYNEARGQCRSYQELELRPEAQTHACAYFPEQLKESWKLNGLKNDGTGVLWPGQEHTIQFERV